MSVEGDAEAPLVEAPLPDIEAPGRTVAPVPVGPVPAAPFPWTPLVPGRAFVAPTPVVPVPTLLVCAVAGVVVMPGVVIGPAGVAVPSVVRGPGVVVVPAIPVAFLVEETPPAPAPDRASVLPALVELVLSEFVPVVDVVDDGRREPGVAEKLLPVPEAPATDPLASAMLPLPKSLRDGADDPASAPPIEPDAVPDPEEPVPQVPDDSNPEADQLLPLFVEPGASPDIETLLPPVRSVAVAALAPATLKRTTAMAIPNADRFIPRPSLSHACIAQP